MLYPLSYQATWIDGQLWVCHVHVPDDSEYIRIQNNKMIECLLLKKQKTEVSEG